MRKFSLAAVLGLFCSLVLLPRGSLAAAASTSPATYHGTAGSAARVTQAASVSGLPKVASAFRNRGAAVFTALRPGGPRPAAARRRAPARPSPTRQRSSPYPAAIPAAR